MIGFPENVGLHGNSLICPRSKKKQQHKTNSYPCLLIGVELGGGGGGGGGGLK